MTFERLKKKKELTAVLKKGKRAYSDTLTLVYLPADRVKMAVCVGKKYGKSVQRNRLKRLLREAFRTQRDILPAAVLLLPKVAESYTFAAFSRDIGKILKREKLLAS